MWKNEPIDESATGPETGRSVGWVRTSEQELEDQQRQCLADPAARLLLQAVPGCVWLLDECHRIVAANREALQFAGREPGSLLGMRLDEVVRCLHAPESAAGFSCPVCHPGAASRAAGNSDGAGAARPLHGQLRATPLTIQGRQWTALVFCESAEPALPAEWLDTVDELVGWSDVIRQTDRGGAGPAIAALALSLKQDLLAFAALRAAGREQLEVSPAEFDVGELWTTLALIFEWHSLARGKALRPSPLPSETRLRSDRKLVLFVLLDMLKGAFAEAPPGETVQLWFEWREGRPVFGVQTTGHENAPSPDPVAWSRIRLFGERHLGGAVSITTDHANRTRYMLFLPASCRPSETPAGSAESVLLSRLGDEAGAIPGAPAAGPPPAPERKILLIEDDYFMGQLVRVVLGAAGFEVALLTDGEAALETMERKRPDLLILDLGLPRLSGLEVCRRVRQREEFRDLPIMFLTASRQEADCVLGLEAGADDYVVKPFRKGELVARVHALLRRSGPLATDNALLKAGDLVLDAHAFRVTFRGEEVEMTALEFRLFHFLASHPNRVFNRRELLNSVWGETHFVAPRIVDVYIRNLRRKLDAKSQSGVCIKTLRGAGYMFEPAQPDGATQIPADFAR